VQNQIRPESQESEKRKEDTESEKRKADTHKGGKGIRFECDEELLIDSSLWPNICSFDADSLKLDPQVVCR
jgi:hypothetical protein